jgi:hypothetical protein
MIIARLSGGLGNQMFIYSTAKCLANEKNDSLLLDDITAYRNYIYKWTYGLDKFNFNETLLSQTSYSFIKYILPIIKKAMEGGISIFKNKIFYYLSEPGNKEFIDFKKINSKIIYLDGYWQNPSYFNSYSELLKNNFLFRNHLDENNTKILNNILESSSVALHARQLRNLSSEGRIVSDDKSKILDVSYYVSAINFIKEKIVDPHFFCFGDNPDWIINNIQPIFPEMKFTPVNNPGEQRSHYDFILIQHCRHVILSNSTFVWWAAWLNNHKNKIVISPAIKYWDNESIIAKDWIVL